MFLKFANNNCTPYGWWLRTSNTHFNSCPYVIGSDGGVYATNASDINEIRLAFCVANNVKIQKIRNRK